MKKLILSILLFTAVGLATAQDYSDQSFREQKRAERRQAMEAKLSAAILAQNFEFTANTMQTNFGGVNQVPFQHNYLAVYPEFFEINLPYYAPFAVVNTPRLFNYTTSNYKITTIDNQDTWVVVIDVENPINRAQNALIPSMSYRMHFLIYKTTGITTLTITPNMSNAMTYEGFVSAMN